MSIIGILNMKRFLKRLRKNPLQALTHVPKRIRVVFGAVMMTLVMLMSTFFPFSESWYYFFFVIILAAYFFSYLAILEEIHGIEWFMLFLIPCLFCVSAYFFYALFPVRWLTRLPYLITFGALFYASLLVSNIFNVGVEKSLKLYRAAFSINYLMQTVIIFLLAQVVFSFKYFFLFNSVLLAVTALVLGIHLVWAVNPSEDIGQRVLPTSLLFGVLIGQLAALVSFIPLQSNVSSLIITASFYSLAGIIMNHFQDRLFKDVIREFLFVFVFVVFISLLTVQW